MKLTIDSFFNSIKNGSWHSIDELSTQLSISITKIKELSGFFSDSGLIKYDIENQKIKIQPLWSLLLPKTEEIKSYNKTLANLIIPPHTSIKIQSTQITNESNNDIELLLRFTDKISEIAVNELNS